MDFSHLSFGSYRPAGPLPVPVTAGPPKPASFTPLEPGSTKYVLIYNGVRYETYELIDHGVVEAPMKFSRARTYTGIADSFPPLEGGLMAYRTYDYTLRSYLLANRGAKGRISDPVKAIMRDLGFIMIYCYKNGMKFDIDDRLEKVYICMDRDYPRVKAVVLPGVDDTNWKKTLVDVLRNIISILNEPLVFGKVDPKDVNAPNFFANISDEEFNVFLAALDRTGDIAGSVEKCFRCTFFWMKSRRLSLINKLGELVENSPNAFYHSLRTQSLLGWRDTMKADPAIGGLVVSDAEQNKVPTDNITDHEAREIDCLLKFVRGNLAHFATLTAGLFSGPEEWLDHFEGSFPIIMSDIYKGAVRVEECGLHAFYL